MKPLTQPTKKQVLQGTSHSTKLENNAAAGYVICPPPSERGISLIELIMFIVIVSVALAGVVLVLNTTTKYSADPLIHKQALTVAESLLEEIEMQGAISGVPDGRSQDRVPTMTSNTAPSGTASASTDNGPDYAPWKAFDKVLTYYGWITSASATGWLAYEFTSAKTIIEYSLYLWGSAQATRMPKTWTFEGWTGSAWTVLHTVTNDTGSWGAGEKRYYTVSSPGSYIKYKIDVTVNHGDANLEIDGMELFGADIPPTKADRINFSDVMDYNGFATTGVYPANGAAVVSGLQNYNVAVAVSSVVWGNIPSASAVQITVAVTDPMGQAVSAIGYRVAY